MGVKRTWVRDDDGVYHPQTRPAISSDSAA